MRDFAAAHIGFTGRFNRAARRLDREGGPAILVAQAHFHFGERLVIPTATRHLTTRLRDNILDRGRLRWIGTHFLDGSDWSRIVEPLEKSSSHAEITELVETRQDFRAGARYRAYAKRIADGATVKRNRIAIDTIEKLDNFFEYYLSLIADIEKNGIVPHSDLGLLGQTGRRHRWTRTLWQDLAERDIGVAIDAGGRLDGVPALPSAQRRRARRQVRTRRNRAQPPILPTRARPVGLIVTHSGTSPRTRCRRYRTGAS